MFTTGITLQVSVLGRRGPWLFFTDVSRGPWTESGTYVSFQMLLNESHHRWLTQPRNGPHSCNAEEAGEVFSLPETNVPFRQRGQMSPSILSAFQGACGTSCVILINDVELTPSPSLSYFYFLLIYRADKRQFIPFPRVGWLFSSYISTVSPFLLEESKHIPNLSLQNEMYDEILNSCLMKSSTKKIVNYEFCSH